MIELQLTDPSPPLQSFDAIQVPDFTLITGLNGAGKTCFLSAMKEGTISVRRDGRGGRLRSVMHSGVDLAPRELATKGDRNPSDVRELAWEAFVKERTDYPQNFKEDRVHESFHYDLDEERVSFKIFSRGKRAADVTRDDFDAAFLAPPLHIDMFQHGFSHLFIAWRRLRHEHIVKAHEGAPALPLEAFQAAYGPPPWETFNKLVSDAGLDVEVVGPNMLDMGLYFPYMRRRSSGETMTMEMLSSGEKILMSFVIALFNAGDIMTRLTKPALLLLDEPDAHLHPAMAQRILRLRDRLKSLRE